MIIAFNNDAGNVTGALLWEVTCRARLFAECNNLKDPLERAWNVVVARKAIGRSAGLYRTLRQRELIFKAMEHFK